MELTGIALIETDGQVFLHYEPIEGAPPVDRAMLHALLAQPDYAGCWLDEEAIAQAANDCNSQSASFVVKVAQRRDAEIHIEIASDDMAVQITLEAPRGGKPAQPADVFRALAEAGVVFGIDEAAVAQACAAGQISHFPVASGVLPENGNNTVFESLLPQTIDRAPKLDANGLIDYREHGSIFVVKPGDALMRRVPPTPGTAGHTVRGRELSPRAGRDEAFATQLSGAEVDSQNPSLLRATLAGQPVLVAHGVKVESLFRLAEVNMATGNINFDGTVQVDGDVVQGMKVKASGDIVVKGLVEGGWLEAGGDVHVAGGIIAQAHVQAQGAVTARFGENCHVKAGTVIVLEDMALQCELESLNQIIVGEKAPQRGRLVGGSATAMMLLRVPILGSGKGGVTRVKVGTNPVLELQLQNLKLRLEQEKTNEEHLQKLMKQLKSLGDPKGLMERVKASWQQALQIWSKSLLEQDELEKQLALILSARVEVSVGVDGAVDLSFGSKTARLRTECDPCVFSFSPETGIVLTNPSGNVTVLAA
nr:FapA family protein [uncultured Rhodoferax sp.]